MTNMSTQGLAAVRAVRRGLLLRADRRRPLRTEDIPATWPMTRHLVRRIANELVREQMLEPAGDAVTITARGRAELTRLQHGTG